MWKTLNRVLCHLIFNNKISTVYCKPRRTSKIQCVMHTRRTSFDRNTNVEKPKISSYKLQLKLVVKDTLVFD